MTLTVYEPPRAWLALQSPALELANAIAATDFVPAQLRNNPAAITAAILYGDEVGLGPMQSLAKIAVINGRPTLAAEAQRALILQRGHEIWIEEATITRCTVAGRRRDSDATSRVTWTMDDAKRAGLAGKPPWRMYPRQMLLARASAELARAVFADAIGGLMATEELEDEADLKPAQDVNGPAEPPRTQTRRRRTAATVPATSATPDGPMEPQPPPRPSPEPANQAETQPEPPPPPPPAAEPPPPMSDQQRPLLMKLYRERGFTTALQRHTYASAMLGRKVESTATLNADEASRLIGLLEADPPLEPDQQTIEEP